MEPKALPPVKINPQKLLGISSVSKKVSVNSISVGEKVFLIRKKVIEIENLLNTNILSKKKEENIKRKEAEQKRFSEKEEKLEKPKELPKEKLKLPSVPKLGFLERIKNFIFSIILGRIALVLLPNLPKLSGIVGTIVKVQDTIIDWTGKILNGLVSFVDKGYEVYDQSRKLLKGIGGDGFLKVFDGFTGAIDKVIEASIIAALAFGELGLGGDALKDTAKEGVRRSAGVFGRGISRSLTRIGLKTIGKDATKGILSVVRPLVKNAPLIGGLLEFGISWALGDPLPKAAFRGVGTALLAAVGTAIGGPIGLAIGGYAGGELGGVLYDMFFANKKPTSTKVQGRAQGGSVTRGGKLQRGPSRTVKKATKREVSVTPTPLKPGSDVGGEKNIQKIFPSQEKKEAGKKEKVNPLGYIKDFYKKTSSINYFGPIFSIAIKRLSGDKITGLDYKNAGKSLNSWMSNTFMMNRVLGAFAEGGEVNGEMFMSGEDLTNVISKSIEENTASKLDRVLGDLQKQLLLEPRGGPGPKDQPTSPSDMINIQGGSADFWTLVAIASREDGDSEGWADVAQSIYNRLASGAYSGSSIKDLILGRMQYEPTWQYPRSGAKGVPNPEWNNITDIASASAATGQSQDALKKVAEAILNPSLQQKARQFVQGRTDFRAYDVSGGIQRKSGDNYFGWYESYKENKIGSVPNFGATLTAGGSSNSLAQAAQSLRGMSSAAGPGGGRIACVWAVNQVFRRAGIRPPWGNSDYVPTAESSMISAGYQRIPIGQQRPGDLYIVARQEHIGIVLPNGNIISNSSSGASFSWEAPLSSYESYYGGPGKFYRMPAPSNRGSAPSPAVSAREITPSSSQVAQRIVSENTSVADNIIKTTNQFEVASNFIKTGTDNTTSFPNDNVKFMSTGGKVKGLTRTILGEEGPEFVIDADSTRSLEKRYPGFLDALNKADYSGALKVLQNYASYEASAPIYVAIDKSMSPVLFPVPVSTGTQMPVVGVTRVNEDYMASSFKR